MRFHAFPNRLRAIFAFVFTCGLALSLIAPMPALAQAAVVSSDAAWQATYWNNVALTGRPALQRSEPDLNNDWGANSPDPSVKANGFSARWTRYVYFDAGTYRFDATSDDGVRVYVDNVRIINAWFNHGAQTFSATRNLAAGRHLVTVYYYDNSGPALVHLAWSQVSSGGGNAGSVGNQSGPNWRAEYFNNRDLTGSPVLVRDDNNIDFNWAGGSPQPGLVNLDNFSARWTRSLDLVAGNYRFTVTVDDGARLWVNNQLLIDKWRDQAVTTYVQTIALPGGPVPVRLEYYEGANVASIRLAWERTDNSTGNSGGSGSIDNSDFQPDPTGRWRGEYFNNPNLSGDPVRVHHDSEINFNWGNDAPSGSVNADNFSVRWTNTLDFPRTGNYRFETETDDGVRLYVDDQPVIDQWHTMARKRYRYDAQISQGKHRIRMEYFDAGGSAYARLAITALDTPDYVGNIITCVPPQPANYAWIKIYRLDGNGNWVSISRGIGSIQASGFLKIDGLPVDVNRFGSAGEPYRIEQWIGGKVVQSVGNTAAGQPEFRLRPKADNTTPWQCR